MKERLLYVDVCKGLLILMVIWQHIPAFVSWAGVDSSVIESCGGGQFMVVLGLLYASLLFDQRIYLKFQKKI